MSHTPYSYPMTGGMDRSASPIKADPASFYLLKNMRPSRTERGKLEQTPYFYIARQYDRGTYYAGGVVTEAAASAIRLRVSVSPSITYVITDSVGWVDGAGLSQLKTYEQSVTTSGTGLNGGCLLVIDNTIGLGLGLGQALDVQIDTATTFRWRLNGGAWTSLVPITTSGVSIAGNARVFFLTTTGFTVNDIWTWTRKDSILGETLFAATPITGQLPYVIARGEMFFLSSTGRLYKTTINGSNESYAITGGYRPIYGYDLIEFKNHLFIAGGLETVDTSPPYTAATRFRSSAACSDLFNYDNFIATDVNEADLFTFYGSTYNGTTLGSLVGFFVTQNTMFIVCRDGIYSSAYLGLPTVFNFELTVPFTDLYSAGNNTLTRIVRADRSCYLVAQNSIMEFNGVGFTDVGAPLRSLFASASWIGAVWLTQHQELVMLTGTTMYVLQARTGLWHQRGAGMSETIGGLGTDVSRGLLYLFATARTVYLEDVNWTTGTLEFDSLGTVFTLPEVQFQLVHDGWIQTEKEVINMWVTGLRGTFSGGNYETGFLSLGYRDSTDGVYPTSWTSFPTTFTAATSFGDLKEPRTPFRALAIRIVLDGPNGGALAPARLILAGVELMLYNMTKQEVRR